jgi:hypothetical protein
MDTEMILHKENNQMLKQLIALAHDFIPQMSNRVQPQNEKQINLDLQQSQSDIEFEVAKGKNYLVVMMIWLMVRKGWIIVKDSKTGKEINVENASQWFYQKIFGEPIKKWDQVLQYIFRWRNKKDKEKFLKTFDTMKDLVEQRIKKG